MSYAASTAPFAGAAPYYKYRAPYAPEALVFVRDAFALDGTSRVLDLGCGPGKIAIAMSRMVGEVVALDPEPAMLAVGRDAAAEAQRGNIRWLHARAEDVSPELGVFHAVTGMHGDIMIPEDRLKAAVVKAALGDTTLLHEIDKLLGKPWDDELETFRHAGEGAPVRWLHQVV